VAYTLFDFFVSITCDFVYFSSWESLRVSILLRGKLFLHGYCWVCCFPHINYSIVCQFHVIFIILPNMCVLWKLETVVIIQSFIFPKLNVLYLTWKSTHHIDYQTHIVFLGSLQSCWWDNTHSWKVCVEKIVILYLCC